MVEKVLSTRVDRWIHQKISDDATVVSSGKTIMQLILNNIGPDDVLKATWPQIQYSTLSEIDFRVIGGSKLKGDIVQQVQAIDNRPTYERIEPIADRLVELFSEIRNEITDFGIVILSCNSEAMLKRAERDGDLRSRYLGPRLRIEAQEL